MDISVVVPAFNEEIKIRSGVLVPVARYLDDHFPQWEIIISDDGSTDKTVLAAKIAGLSVFKQAHRGKAAAVINGVLHARYPLTLLMDMDQATPINMLERFCKVLEPGSMCYGDRGFLGRKQPISRKALTLAHLIVRALLVPDLGWIDTQCGFKLWWTADLRNVISHLNVYQYKKLAVGKRANVNSGFDVECMLVARMLGLTLVGVGVEWEHKGTGRVRFGRDARQGLADLWAIWKADMQGAYDQFNQAVPTG